MSRIYRNRKSGLIVVSGTIKSISEDRMQMTVAYEEYDEKADGRVAKETNVTSGIPFEDTFKVGFDVTVSGYPRGSNVIYSEAASIGNSYFAIPEVAVVSGTVKFARMNEEKNEDGTPKTKRDGSARKPHYDIGITVYEDGKPVTHVIKVYEGNPTDGQKSQLESVKKLFANFDRETNRIRATFVTTPGEIQDYTVTRDGKEYINYRCDHIGYNSMDIGYLDRDKQQTKPQQGKTNGSKPQEQPTQTAQPSQPVVQQEAPQVETSGAGFDAPDLDMGDDELFQ